MSVSSDPMSSKLTFGRNTRQSVAVVQKMMKREMIKNEASCLSVSTWESGAPSTHIITLLYTLIPMYFESFRAGIDTFRVSHARKQPNSYKHMTIKIPRPQVQLSVRTTTHHEQSLVSVDSSNKVTHVRTLAVLILWDYLNVIVIRVCLQKPHSH